MAEEPTQETTQEAPAEEGTAQESPQEEPKAHPVMDALKTAKIVTEEKVVKPLIEGVKTAPGTTVHVAKDATKITADAAVKGAKVRNETNPINPTKNPLAPPKDGE